MFGSISKTIAADNQGENKENKAVIRMGYISLFVLIAASVVFFVLKNILHLYEIRAVR